MDQETNNLPAKIADAILSIPKGLTPGMIKALDRLVCASIDVPIAWLNQKNAKIDAQTESYKLVEASVAKSVASDVDGDAEIVQRAMTTLVRKEYRKQTNKEAVAAAMVEDMRSEVAGTSVPQEDSQTDAEIDEDWLNVFERYAEDASSERLQGLWGKVLAGEVRRPGRFSTRTLRFLSEFSQADALLFEDLAKTAFGDSAPKKAVIQNQDSNISHLIQLEASGLIQGARGNGLQKVLDFDLNGRAYLREGNLVVILIGEPQKKFSYEALILTPIGQEVLSLLGNRDAKDAAKQVAESIRTPQLYEALLGVIPTGGATSKIQVMEILLQNDAPEVQSVDGTTS